jgi:hypothetical protein
VESNEQKLDGVTLLTAKNDRLEDSTTGITMAA